jgi:mucin-19
MALYIQLSTQNVLTKFLSVSSITGGNSVNTSQLTSTVGSLLTNSVIPPQLSTQAIFTSSISSSVINTSVVSTLVLYASSIVGVVTGGGGLTSLPSSLSTFAIFTSSLQASTVQAASLSTLQLFASSIQTNALSSVTVTANDLIGTTLFVSSGLISTLSTNSLNFAGGFGYLTMPDIYPNTVYTSTLTASNLQVGINSVQSPIQFFGFGSYLNSVIAELSTGATTQELLIFRGSNATDRIRMQTTGSIVFEPGVSGRLWPTVPSNVTPAMIINTSSNVGIQLVSPSFPLDVGGTGRFLTLSTLALNISSINGTVYAAGGGGITTFPSTISSSALITSNLLIPFSTFRATSTFIVQTNTASSLVTFGTTQASGQSQYYFGDLYNQLNFSTLSSPMMLLESTFPSQNISTIVFTSTGVFRVPSTVYYLNMNLWGSGGSNYTAPGGGGAFLSGYLPVNPGDVYTVRVNQNGGSGSFAAGGGMTVVYSGLTTTYSNVVAIAAGGGAGGSFATSIGGAGGVVFGSNGTYRNTFSGGGAGGTQTSGAFYLFGAAGTVGGGAGLYGGGSGENNSVDIVGGGGGSSLFSNFVSWVGQDGISGGVGGGKFSPYYVAASNWGNCNTLGAAVFAFSPGFRFGNLLELRDPTSGRMIGISPQLNMGINVSSVTRDYTLTVNGTTWVSTLTALNSITSNLTIPYQSSNPNPALNSTNTTLVSLASVSTGAQIAFGTTDAFGTIGNYSQILMRDALQQRGYVGVSTPTLLIQQDVPWSKTANTQIMMFSTTTLYTVPSSMTTAKAYMWGQGGRPYAALSNGGGGAYVSGAFQVRPGEILQIAVNHAGGTSAFTNGGGGLTGIFRSSINFSTSVAIAAGGGGGGSFMTTVGGAGGILIGSNGTYRNSSSGGGPGGTQVGGGGGNGTALQGGASSANGGGGGAGYYGGGGGGDNSVDRTGGGGGSSFLGGLFTNTIVAQEGYQGPNFTGLGGGKASPFYSVASNWGDQGVNGYAVVIFTSDFRTGNLLETRNTSMSSITGIGNFLTMGVRVSTITSSIELDVGGQGRFLTVSSLAINVSSINGVLYTASGARQATPMFLTF